MLLDIFPLEIWIYILRILDESEEVSTNDLLNVATCDKSLMNALIQENIKFYKVSLLGLFKFKSPFFSYDIIDNNTKEQTTSKKIIYCLHDNSKFNMIPKNTQEILFCNGFNDSIDKLPDSVMCIRLGISFDRPIHELPTNLKMISIHCFNTHIVEIENLINANKRLKIVQYF